MGKNLPLIETRHVRGINWFDTAELYGNGASERALSKALLGAGSETESC